MALFCEGDEAEAWQEVMYSELKHDSPRETNASVPPEPVAAAPLVPERPRRPSWCRNHRDFKQRFVDQVDFQVRGLHTPITVQQSDGENGTGTWDEQSTVWDAALVLSAWLAQNPGVVAGKNVLELGAGCGVCGLVAASLGAQRVVLTDREALLPLLRKNVEQNATVCSDCAVEVSQLDWCNLDLGSLKDFEVVLGSDVVYEIQGFSGLVAVLQALSRNGAKIVMANQRRWADVDGDFHASLQSLFRVDVVPLAEHDPVYRADNIDILILSAR